MSDIQRLRVSLSGFIGAPGVMTLYFLDAAAAQTALFTWLSASISVMPSATTATQAVEGDIIDDLDGKITGTWTGPGSAVVSGGSGGAYSAPSGMLVNWLTSSIADGRRLRGKTFIVPLGGGTYGSDGTLDDTLLTNQRAAAASLVASQGSNMVVWHRPKFGPRPVGGGARPLLRSGSHAVVTGSSVNDKACVLRSRRD